MRGEGPSKKAVARRLARGTCAEPGCKNPALKVGPREYQRCRACLLKLAAQVEQMRKERKQAGLCRCGKESLLPPLKRGFKCTFGIAHNKVEDWVELFEEHPMAWVKIPRG